MQAYDHVPYILPAEWQPRSSQCAQKCQHDVCPVIQGYAPPARIYNETLLFKDPDEQFRVFVVLESPALQADTFWQSPKGKFLTSIIHQQRPAGTSVAVGYLTKCVPPGKVMHGHKYKVSAEAIGYCGSHLYEEIQQFDPHSVVLMGAGTSKAFLGNNASLMDLRKKAHMVNYGDKERLTVCTLSVDFVATQPYQGAVVRIDLAKAFYWAKNGIEQYQAFHRPPDTVVFDSTDKGIDAFEEKVNSLVNAPNPVYVAWDTETASLSKSKNRLFSFGFSDHPSQGYAINYDHPRSTWTDGQKVRIKGIIKTFVTAPNIIGISHNSQFDLSIIRITLGIKVTNNEYNSFAMAHALDEEFSSKEYTEDVYPKYVPTWKALDDQSKFWFDFDDEGWLQMKGYRKNLAALLTPQVDNYCAMDCSNTLKIFYCLYEALYNKNPAIVKTITDIMKPIDRVLSHVERAGVPLDKEVLLWHLDATAKGSGSWKLKQLQEKFLAMPNAQKLNDFLISEMPKQPLFGNKNYVNLDSPLQMQQLFYTVLGHQPTKQRDKKTGKMEDKKPTDKEFLDMLVEGELVGWEEAQALKEYRQFGKLVNTFIVGFYNNASEHNDFRVRANFNGSKTVTYRLSANNPNVQQIPRSGEKENVAKGFVKKLIKARPGYALISSDYGTMEVRGAAIASLDDILASTFNNAFDLREQFLLEPTVEAFEKLKFEGDAHRNNAVSAYGVPIREVTKDQRTAAKGISFLCIYSANPAPQLAQRIDVSVDEAQKVIDKFLGKLTKLNDYLSSRDPLAENYGFVMTPFGRCRSLYAAMFPEKKKEYTHCINQGRNTGVQSSSSDSLLLSVDKMIEYIDANEKDWKIVNVVHDSALAEVPIPEVPEFCKLLQAFMESPGLENFGIDPEFCKLAADSEIGFSYKDMVAHDGTPEHMERIMAWLNTEAPTDNMPVSYFEQHLDAKTDEEKENLDELIELDYGKIAA